MDRKIIEDFVVPKTQNDVHVFQMTGIKNGSSSPSLIIIALYPVIGSAAKQFLHLLTEEIYKMVHDESRFEKFIVFIFVCSNKIL